MPQVHLNFRDPEAVKSFVRSSFSNDQRRLRHIEVIAERVRQSAELLRSNNPNCTVDPDFAYCAALLHDIGYLADIRHSGFHPTDGGRFLRAEGFADLAELIECHSCAPEEALLLGHPPIAISEHLIAKLITYWDMRIMQGGDIVTYEERLADILSRYGENSVVSRANLMAKSRLEALSVEVETLLRAAEQNLPSQSRPPE